MRPRVSLLRCARRHASVNLLDGSGNPRGSGGLKEADQVEADPIGSGCPRGCECLGVRTEEVILGGSDRELRE